MLPQQRLRSKQGFELPRRLVRSAPQATRNLLARCQSLGVLAGLLRAMLLLGLPPGPLWLNSMGRSLEVLLKRHPQRAQELHAEQHGRGSPSGSNSLLTEDVKEVVCVLLAMRIWAQQELRRAKASEKWRQCQHTLSPEGGGTALHESHQSMPFAEGINIGGGTEELTQEHSTSGADQRERPLWSQASFKARGSGVGGGDGVWPEDRAAAALTTCRRLGLRVASVLAEAEEEGEEDGADSKGHASSSWSSGKTGSGSALGSNSASCGGSRSADNQSISRSDSMVNSPGSCSNSGRTLRLKNASIRPALACISDRELRAALCALYWRQPERVEGRKVAKLLKQWQRACTGV